MAGRRWIGSCSADGGRPAVRPYAGWHHFRWIRLLFGGRRAPGRAPLRGLASLPMDRLLLGGRRAHGRAPLRGLSNLAAGDGKSDTPSPPPSFPSPTPSFPRQRESTPWPPPELRWGLWVETGRELGYYSQRHPAAWVR